MKEKVVVRVDAAKFAAHYRKAGEAFEAKAAEFLATLSGTSSPPEVFLAKSAEYGVYKGKAAAYLNVAEHFDNLVAQAQ
jgi:hypothetical protein